MTNTAEMLARYIYVIFTCFIYAIFTCFIHMLGLCYSCENLLRHNCSYVALDTLNLRLAHYFFLAKAYDCAVACA